jgi:hypothetical protein
MIGRAAEVFDVAGAEPLGEVTGDIAGTVVGQQPRSICKRRSENPSLKRPD